LEEDWHRADHAVEEFLRFVSPVQFSKPRLERKDVQLASVRLNSGDRIMPMLVAGNFDPVANEHPEISTEGRTGTSRSGRVFIFAWATSSRELKLRECFKPCLSVGRSWAWR
jgi:hypothetical protein